MVKRGSPVSERRLLLAVRLLLILSVLASQCLSTAQAQDLANSQCGQYVEAYQGGPAGYTPYLQAAEQVAKARDAQQGGTPHYLPALRHSAPSANALWLNNWCTKNPLKGFTEASSRLVDELTGQSKPADATLPTPPQQIVVVARSPFSPVHARLATTVPAPVAPSPAGTEPQPNANKAQPLRTVNAVPSPRSASAP